ncbi:MAG TPA: M48 family metalloprotease [Micromonosporaceae bacterium]|nr:M48 family metalloprotease [Micromonosporaceae bacterium]
MRRIVHALTVVVLLAGFYVLCLAILAALVALDVVVTKADASAPALAREVAIAYLLTAVAVYVVVRGVFVSTRVRHRHIVGVMVTDRDEPALWERVRFLARAVGTRPPARIYLVPDVNAAVWENAKLLGLIPGRRSMMIGMPLLIALTPAQFDSVIAHELGHYGNRDTRLGALDHRARESVMAAVAAAQGRLTARRGADGKPRRFRLPGQAVFVALFRMYARLVLSVTQHASRRQEIAADSVAAAIAGQANAAAGLRELPAVEAAFSFYIDRYVAAGVERDMLPIPGEVLGGFAALLAEPSRRAELDDLRQDPTAETPDPFDSHPAIRDRIATIEALPPDGRPLDTSDARALATLSDPKATLAAVGARMLVRNGAGKQAVDWDTLATAAAADRAARSADPLRIAVASFYQQPRALSGLLDAIDAGQLGEILDRLPKSDGATKVKAGTRAARELAKTSMIPMVAAWALAELAAQGRVRWRNSWADADGAIEMAPDLDEKLQAAVDALAAVSPDAGPMRAVVYAMGVPA